MTTRSLPRSRFWNAFLVLTFDAGTFAHTVTPDPDGWTETWNGAGTVVTLTHAAFDAWEVYTVTITSADDPAGNPLVDTPYGWSFETVPHTVHVPLMLND